MNTFKGRDFLKLLDFTPAEIGALLDLSADLKAKKKKRRGASPVRGEKSCPDF